MAELSIHTKAEQTSRHIILDALRGFAVMGILAMNIIDFSMPDTAYMSPAVHGGSSGSDLVSWYASFVLIDGKMRALFALLFGASLLLVVDRAEANGENTARVHFSRMVWLAIFGLIHFYLIWFGDILFVYAAIGCIAYLFRHWEPRRLIKWAVALFLVGAIFWTIAWAGPFALKHSVENDPNPHPVQVQELKEILDQSEYTARYAPKQIAIHLGSYTDIVKHRWTEMRFTPFARALMSITEILPIMMLGMALLRNGFLLGAWDRRRYLSIACWTLPIGGALTLLIAWVMDHNAFHVLYVLPSQLAWSIVPRLMMAIGYAALLILLIKSLSGTAILARVAAAGRAAFSNYLGTSLVMTTIFYGYGFGLFGSISRTETWIFVLGAVTAMLLWSKPWLDHFRYGPLEWLWRSLARGCMQPMRIMKAV